LVKKSIDDFAATHHKLLEDQFEASLDALPDQAPPAAPEYGMVTELAGADFEGFADVLRYEYVLDPNAERLALRTMSMTIPITATRSLGLNMSTTGTWLSLLHSAKPSALLCGRERTKVTVCLDYGGLDVFIVRFAPHGSSWAPEGIAWQQRGQSTP
jgi:hypothetical protein